MTEQQSVYLEAYKCCGGDGNTREVRYEDLLYAIGVVKAVRAFKKGKRKGNRTR